MTEQGYVLALAPDHPRAHQGRVREHILVMEAKLGRLLTQDENVHHINGDRADNRVENLELWSSSQPSGQRVAAKLAWARDIIDKYSGHVD